MSRRDFDTYYNKIYSQLHSLQEAFDDLAKEVAEGMVEPERLEQLKLTIEPIKNSYQSLCYIKYLLDMPKKKTKRKKYPKLNTKLWESSGDKNGDCVVTTNQSIIDSLKK